MRTTNETRTNTMKLIYARISTDDKGQTIESQLHAIKAAGHTTAPMYFKDEGISGSVTPENRPGLASLLNLAKRGDLIIVTALDRLSRSTYDAIALMKALEGKGVKVLSLREQELSTATADGNFLLQLYAALGERERRITSERVKQGIARYREANAGKPWGRTPNEEAHRQAREMLAKGCSVPEVMQETGLSRATVYRIKREGRHA
ncbi:recombinase family protein [Salmonella enterica]|nr:recombinase family protein [Salmonella enterica]